MSSTAKKLLRRGLLRYRADPSSDAYRKCHKKATEAGIHLPSTRWPFPDPAAVQPADPDAARAAAKREHARIKKAKQRAKKKQKVAEENAGSGRRAFQDVTNAQQRQAYRT